MNEQGPAAFRLQALTRPPKQRGVVQTHVALTGEPSWGWLSMGRVRHGCHGAASP
jgi:hypothetical protein